MYTCTNDFAFNSRRMKWRPEYGVLSLDPTQRKRYSQIIDELYWMAFDILKPIVDPKLEYLRTGVDDPDILDGWFDPETIQYIRHKPNFVGFIKTNLVERVSGKVVKFDRTNINGAYVDTDIMMYSVTEQVINDYILAIDLIECGMAKDSPGLKMSARIIEYFENYTLHEQYDKMMKIIERMIKNHFVLRQDVIDALCQCSNSQALMEVLKMDDGSVFTPKETLKLDD